MAKKVVLAKNLVLAEIFLWQKFCSGRNLFMTKILLWTNNLVLAKKSCYDKKKSSYGKKFLLWQKKSFYGKKNILRQKIYTPSGKPMGYIQA